MRVTIVSKTFVASTAQRQLEWLARQPGVALTLITPPRWHSDDGRTLPFIPAHTSDYAAIQLPVVFNGRYHLYLYRGLAQALLRSAPDIVHIDDEPYNPATFQAQRAANRLGAATLIVAWQNLQRQYPPPYSWIERYNYRHTRHIIAGNQAAADVVRAKGYTGLLSVFSVHGVDPELYSPRARRGSAPSGEPFEVVYLGRVVRYKGLGVLIEALARLPGDVRLRVIGAGPDREALRQEAAAAGLGPRVAFESAVPASSVPDVLATADALVLPSLTQPNWSEQFGRVLIEAMACGVPVVGSDSGEIPRVIGDAGLVVPEGQSEPLAKALQTLYRDAALRQRMGEAGRERVLRHFTQERVASQLMDVYRQMLATNARDRVAGTSHPAHEAPYA